MTKDVKMKRIVLSTIFMALVLSGCKKGGSGASVDLKTEDDKTFYTVGAMFGGRLANLSLNEQELNALAAGLRDAANGTKPKVKIADYQKKVQEVFRGRISKNTDKIKTTGNDFMANFLKEPGVQKTASGLAYKIEKPGAGAKPNATDTVEVHYHGTLIDGTVFDSSVDRGKKVSFPLNRVIKGWTEGLQLIKEGGKVKLVIPSELAYGDHGAPPKIPGGSTLVFEVELFKVSKTAAAPAPAPAPKDKKK
jgi:FKBP-type peptidyl-prolyl cis-trans isomerase FkpA